MAAFNLTGRGMSETPPFGFAQGHESFDLVQDRELVERPVEWQMGFIRSCQKSV